MDTAEAVKCLRSHFGESQQSFSNRLKMSIASITHYETGARAPDAISLRKLYLLAVGAFCHDIAGVFGQAIASELDEPDFYDVNIESQAEFHAIRALQLIRKDDRFKAQRKIIAKALAPVEKELQHTAALTRIPASEIRATARRMMREALSFYCSPHLQEESMISV